MQATQTAVQTPGQLSPNSRYIEVQYDTPSGYATPHFHPSEEEKLERKLISLKRRRIPTTVINLLTQEIVGGVEPPDSNNPWAWWYSPEGINAKAEPARSRRVVSNVEHPCRRREESEGNHGHS